MRWLFLILYGFIACSHPVEPQGNPPPVISTTQNGCKVLNTLTDDATNVLFIGNSLTYVNQLPTIVKGLANERGINMGTQMEAKANYALEDHWVDGCIQQLIESRKFDFVIVQQGPSSQEDGRVMLLEYGAKLKSLCDANDAKLAFFMVWPAKANYANFAGVIQNYTHAAEQTKSLLIPVGKYWKAQCDKGDFSYMDQTIFIPPAKEARWQHKQF
jgi:hypothetical protein